MKESGENRSSNGSKKRSSKAGRNGDSVSLYPLTPEEAMRALLRVPPEPKAKQTEQAKKRG